MGRGSYLGFIACFFFSLSPLVAKEAFEKLPSKLPSKYTISYGDPKAPISMTEYFSFSCPSCLAFIQKELTLLKEKYTNRGRVYLIFHPDPADIVTMQVMRCFERLFPEEKQQFLEKIVKELPCRSQQLALLKVEKVMAQFRKEHEWIKDLSLVETSDAFYAGYQYITQAAAPTKTPTVEIDGVLYEEFPTLEWIDHMIEKKEKLRSSL